MLYSIIKINIHNLQNLQKSSKNTQDWQVWVYFLWSARAKLLPVFVGNVGTVDRMETGKEKSAANLFISIDIFNITTITGS